MRAEPNKRKGTQIGFKKKPKPFIKASLYKVGYDGPSSIRQSSDQPSLIKKKRGIGIRETI